MSGSSSDRADGRAGREFLVRIALRAPHVADAELERLRAAESRRAAELADQGVLLRLWRPEGPGWRNVGLWRAADEAALREALGSLPLRPWMTVDVTPLGPHPNDPVAGRTARVAADPRPAVDDRNW